MPDLRQLLLRVQSLQTKFEGLLASARMRGHGSPGRDEGRTRLRELTGFGGNPGNLRMFVYAPKHQKPNAALVIALHGCTQTAEEYDRGSGWSSLADDLGCVVVYPQQQPANNPKNCFSWFSRSDIVRGRGEALSIKEMVDHAVTTFGTDRRKVFVTGLSAGGAMASVMLATYPEVFAGGAIIAGLPYGCASNVQQAFEAMFTDREHTADVLGDRVRAATSYRGPWPKISVWHGTSDPIVKPSNSEEIIRQWANLHGLSQRPSYRKMVGSHTLRVWTDVKGEALIEAFSISNMAHGVPLATTGQQSCGTAGAFFLDAGISSTHHIARSWGLTESFVDIPHHHSAPVIAPVRQVGIGATEGSLSSPAEVLLREGTEEQAHGDPHERQNSYRLDPNAVIAAAFKSAGLPAPEFPTAQTGATSDVVPRSIIAAALKAAGLVQKRPGM
jgi:poly(hydroxyalkanoate) depolymerase family esterase